MADTIKEQHPFTAIVEESLITFPTAHPTGEQILKSVNKRPCSHFVVQIIRGADDQVIDPYEKADLSRAGFERFTIVARDVVEITIDDHSLTIPRGRHTVKELKRLGGVPNDDKFSLDVDGRLQDLEDHEVIDIRGCEAFDSRKQAGGSS